jgi:uncharacterized protein (DUF488 family)
MEILTVGVNERSAEEFFETLRREKVRRVVDIRLKNVGQLLAFSMRRDLPYFLREIVGAEYEHRPELAPSEALFALFREGKPGWWEKYQEGFLALLAERRVEEKVPRALFEVSAALLCSCSTQERCHRRLTAEYLGAKWGLGVRHVGDPRAGSSRGG